MNQKKITTAAKLLSVPAIAAFLAMPILGGMTASAASASDIPAAPVFDSSNYGMGDTLDETEYFSDPAESTKKTLRRAVDTAASVPASVDLSQTEYFPPIDSQMSIGSCYAWSSVYYQYTYEANKLNGIETTAQNAYSPAFVFNFRSGGRNVGGTCTDVYEFLKEHGSLRMEDMPVRSVNGEYWINGDNYDYSWSTDTEAMIEALHTRVTGHDAVTISSRGTEITGPQDDSLNEIKQRLADGHVACIRVTGFEWDYATRMEKTANGVSAYHGADGDIEYVAYRAEDASSGHGMTVVGYDDSVWYDINHNGEVEDAELGAFKVANSWGDDYYNDGFIWVMYDALNGTSAVPGNWEANEYGTRIPIFDRGVSVNGQYNVNAFYFITVENKEVNYVGQLDVTSGRAHTLNVSIGRNNPGSPVMTSRNVFSNPVYSGVYREFDGTLVFDYASFCEPIGDYLTGYNWDVDLSGTYSSASFRITDDLSNTIVDFGALETGSAYESRPINIALGDLNYDGQYTQADRDYYENAEELSTLQEYLAQFMHEIPEPISDITATASVAASWDGGQIISVTVKNNGTAPVNGWALRADNFGGEIVSIWGANVLSGNVVTSASYNAEIPAGGEVTFGYQVSNPTGTAAFTVIADRADFTEDCAVLLDASNSWGNGFVGYITIQNNSDEAMYGWELTVSAEGFSIVDSGSFNWTENADGTYTITGANGNTTIAAHATLVLQFTAAQTGTPSLTVISMTAADLG